MVSRRRLLASIGSTGVIISVTGCIGTRWWEDDTENTESSDSSGDNTNTSSSSDDQTDTEETHSDTNTGSTDTDDRNEITENEGNGENRQHKPDEEDLEVNEDKYENHGSSETHERTPEDITVKTTAELEKSGGAAVAGTVTNVSEESIDVVDLEVTFYDESGSYLTADLVSITNLDPNASESFEITIPPDQARGEPDHIDIQPTVYDRSD